MPTELVELTKSSIEKPTPIKSADTVSIRELDPTMARQVATIKEIAAKTLPKKEAVKLPPLREQHTVLTEESEIDKTRKVAAASGALASISNPHSLRSLYDLASLETSGGKAAPIGAIDPLSSSAPFEDPSRSLFDLVQSRAASEKEKNSPFPNLAAEMLKLGQKMEQFQSEEKIQKYDAEGRQHKHNIDLLLQLGTHLQKFSSEQDSHDLTDAMKQLFVDLRGQKIDLFPGIEIPASISREELSSLKSLLSSRVDEQKMHVQDLFSTKISIAIQFMNTTQDMMKEVIRKDERQKSAAVRGQQRQ